MRLNTAVAIHVGPVIDHQPIERVPQRLIIGIQHLLCDPPKVELTVPGFLETTNINVWRSRYG
jgi:hypothetical protein